MSTTSIYSPYPPTECLRRIEARFDAPLGRSIQFLPGGRFLGRIEGDTFKVVFTGPPQVLLSPGYPKLVFVGQVKGDGDGSILVGDLDRGPTNVLTKIWFGFLGLILIVLCVYALLNVVRDPAVLFLPFVPIAMMLFGRLVLWSLRLRQDDVARDVAAILTKAVGSQPPTRDPTPR